MEDRSRESRSYVQYCMLADFSALKSANLARAGHSVLLLEAGGDNGNSLIERVPQR